MADTENNKNSNSPASTSAPALRFPGFTEPWRKCFISQLGDIITGNTPSTKQSENYSEDGYLWASPSDLNVTKYVYDTKTRLSQIGFQKTRIIPKHSILVTCIGSTIGKMGMASTVMSTNQQINAVVVNSSFDKDFVYYAIQSRFPKYLSSIAVQAVPILSKSTFCELENYYPSKIEQTKIGELLSLLDERIATQRRLIEKLKTLIKGIVVFHFNNSNTKKTITIKNLGEAYSVGNLSKDDLSEYGKPCIIYGELFTTYGCVASKIQSRTNKYTQATLSKAGDILFPASTTVDAISLIAPTSLQTNGVYVAGDMFGIHILPQFNSEYISYLLNYVYNRVLSKYAQGSTIIHLHYAYIKNTTIQLPCLEEQNKCAELLEALQTKLDVAKQLIDRYQIQKSYLLQQIFI